MSIPPIRALIVSVVISGLLGWHTDGLAQPPATPEPTNGAGEYDKNGAEYEDEEPREIESLGEYLYVVMAVKLGCQYTIEDAQPIDKRIPWIDGRTLPCYDTGLESIDELVVYINTNFKDIRAVRNASFPQVIHLTSWHILDEDYLVDRIIEVPPYKGPVDDFGDHLGTVTDGHVITRNVYSISRPEMRDLTGVETKSERGVLREILTRVAIKEPKRPLLWEVRALGFKNDSRMQVIEVFFPGIWPK